MMSFLLFTKVLSLISEKKHFLIKKILSVLCDEKVRVEVDSWNVRAFSYLHSRGTAEEQKAEKNSTSDSNLKNVKMLQM